MELIVIFARFKHKLARNHVIHEFSFSNINEDTESEYTSDTNETEEEGEEESEEESEYTSDTEEETEEEMEQDEDVFEEDIQETGKSPKKIQISI